MSWTRGAGLVLFSGMLVLGCRGEPVAVESDAELRAASVGGEAALTAAQNRDIAALRSATAAFHRFDVAQDAGYDSQFPAGCFTSDAGAMGFHYLNGLNVGSLDVTKPQLLMYEPQADGSRRLIGVEFIKPGAPTDVAPVLFGRTFKYNSVFQVWVLHVWAWAHNPDPEDGIFADWNPRVSCEHADVISATAHH